MGTRRRRRSLSPLMRRTGPVDFKSATTFFLSYLAAASLGPAPSSSGKSIKYRDRGLLRFSARIKTPFMLVDTHAHLDFPEFAGDLDAVLHRAKEAGVTRIIAIGTTLQSSRKAIHFAEQYPEIYAVVGIHPTSASEEREDFLSELRLLAEHPRGVAIGETGLDYHHLPGTLRRQEVSETTFGASSTETVEADLRDDAEMASQSVAFEQQLELAATMSKNVVIHQRDAWADPLKILRRYSRHLRGVFHCFNGSLEQAQEAIELGHSISF